MITKNDCIILLNDLENEGIDCSKYMLGVVRENAPTMEAIKFINDNRHLELTEFYEKVRKSHNKGHSTLYMNIVKEVEDVFDVLTTLSAFQTQVLIFSKNSKDKEMFLRHSRANEISKALSNYYKTYDLTSCIKVLRAIKADIKALESFKTRN